MLTKALRQMPSAMPCRGCQRVVWAPAEGNGVPSRHSGRGNQTVESPILVRWTRPATSPGSPSSQILTQRCQPTAAPCAVCVAQRGAWFTVDPRRADLIGDTLLYVVAPPPASR